MGGEGVVIGRGGSQLLPHSPPPTRSIARVYARGGGGICARMRGWNGYASARKGRRAGLWFFAVAEEDREAAGGPLKAAPVGAGAGF